MRIRKKRHVRKIGLALSGGSTWGIAHVGVLKALIEENIPIDCVAGTSAGSLVATSYAFGMSIDEMVKAISTLNWGKLSKFSYSRLGLKTNAPMREYLIKMLGDVQIQDSKIPLAIVAADIQTHERIVLREGSVHEAVRASAAIPGYFMPVKIGNRMLVDGGVAENVPIAATRELGATFVIAVNLSGKGSGRAPRSLLGVLVASFSTRAVHHDAALLRTADFVIQPDLTAYDYSEFKDVEQLLDAGYDAARAVMPQLREALGMTAPRRRRGAFLTLLTKLYERLF